MCASFFVRLILPAHVAGAGCPRLTDFFYRFFCFFFQTIPLRVEEKRPPTCGFSRFLAARLLNAAIVLADVDDRAGSDFAFLLSAVKKSACDVCTAVCPLSGLGWAHNDVPKEPTELTTSATTTTSLER